MDIILKIGFAGWLILILQFLAFSSILKLGTSIERSSRPLRATLSRCLRESRDFISDQSNDLRLARDCATRYRLAATRIEDVDAYAISSSEVSRASAGKLFGIHWSYQKVDELLHGGSGFLVTLGLIGTFFGLMGNMVQLSELVLASEDGSQQATLMQGLAEVFPSMAAAFTTSLVGVLLSSVLWIVGTSNGMLGLKDEIADLLCGYLEQVVQADCRRYSLVGESMERMEKYLTDYLSQFSEKIGNTIELAFMKNIASLVNALTYQVDQIASFVSQIKNVSQKLSDAGQLYLRASEILDKSDFAERFGASCKVFLQSAEEISKSSDLLLAASSDNASSSKELAEVISLSYAVNQSLGSSLVDAKENSIQVLSMGIKSIDKLKEATAAVEGIQKRGMTWLSMRAKTDQQLMEINSQLNNVISNIAEVATQVATTKVSDYEQVKSSIASLQHLVAQLTESAKQQEDSIQSVIEGLKQMQSVSSRIAAIENQTGL
jgi:uncharacterized protein Yka (UPF0111/DUF47 family)